jgi:hypothetical protein
VLALLSSGITEPELPPLSVTSAESEIESTLEQPTANAIANTGNKIFKLFITTTPDRPHKNFNETTYTKS